jgi:hypothetical protein
MLLITVIFLFFYDNRLFVGRQQHGQILSLLAPDRAQWSLTWSLPVHSRAHCVRNEK